MLLKGTIHKKKTQHNVAYPSLSPYREDRRVKNGDQSKATMTGVGEKKNKIKRKNDLCRLFILAFSRSEVKILASDAFIHISHIIDCSLEVAGGIVALADEDLGGGTVIIGLLDVSDVNELFIDRTKDAEGRAKLLDGITTRILDSGSASGDPTALGGNAVGTAHDGHIDIGATTDLLLRDDDLSALSVVGVRNGVAEDANGTNNLANGSDTVREVRGVSDDELAVSNRLSPLAGLDTDSLAALHDNALDGSVEHVGTTVDGAETSKALRKLTKTIERIEVRTLGIAVA